MPAKRQKHITPVAIIDNPEYLKNPFHQNIFRVTLNYPCPLSTPRIGRDLEWALKFLFSYNSNAATFRSYRKDLERLLHWCWQVKQKSVLGLKREDIEDFIRFCKKPPKPWIGSKNTARFLLKDGVRMPNPQWRPFVCSSPTEKKSVSKNKPAQNYLFSQASVRALFASLSSFYDFLMQEDVVEANPVARIRQKSKYIEKYQQRRQDHILSNLQWSYIVDTVEQMAEDDPNQHERTRFIIFCLFSMYLRISELVDTGYSAPLMRHFFRDNEGLWWFRVIGKGNKERIISVCDEMLEALKRYRTFLELPPLPGSKEQFPLIPKIRGTGAVTSTRAIRKIVQYCFDQAYESMVQDGFKDDAQRLREATPHWLRHTGISNDVKFRPREHVRDEAGHASMATTDLYINTQDQERHASGRGKSIKDIG